MDPGSIPPSHKPARRDFELRTRSNPQCCLVWPKYEKTKQIEASLFLFLGEPQLAVLRTSCWVIQGFTEIQSSLLASLRDCMRCQDSHQAWHMQDVYSAYCTIALSHHSHFWGMVWNVLELTPRRLSSNSFSKFTSCSSF